MTGADKRRLRIVREVTGTIVAGLREMADEPGMAAVSGTVALRAAADGYEGSMRKIAAAKDLGGAER